MKVYICNNCQNPLYFENSQCLKCSHPVGFDPVSLSMVTLTGKERYCKNAEYGVCNWLVPAAGEPSFCVACELNRVIPSLDSDQNKVRWKNMEVAKHRLIYSLLRLRLPFHVMRESLPLTLPRRTRRNVCVISRISGNGTGRCWGISVMKQDITIGMC